MNNKDLNNKAPINNRNLTEISNNHKNSIKSNTSYDKSLQQSPKIRTGKYRPLSSKPKPFSLLDFDDKRIITKGTNIPSQFKRFSDQELMKIIGGVNERAGNNNTKMKLIQNFLNENDKNLGIKRNNTINIDKNINIKKDNKNKTHKNLVIDIKDSNNNKKIEINKNENNIKNIKKRIEENKTIKKNFNRPFSAQLRQKKDAWLPKGYPEYEYCVLNQKYFQENLKKNPFINNEQIYNLKEIKEKSNKTDIFFLGPKSEKEATLLVNNNNEKSKNYYAKLGSDIFNTKKDLQNLMKSNETFLFKNNNYPISNESKSFWSAKVNVPSYINSPSVEYNILNPIAKCNTKTKERIYDECLKKKNDDRKMNVINYMNPIFRQKSISNFYNITKLGAMGNFAYSKIFKENPRSFNRKNNVCALQCDTYNSYKGIIDKPFMTQINKKVQV